ncbi:Scarecrow-like transcription factor PAT1 [Platanthera zijinensis]|uniref:Scarecrow-like transcription factor PAT1 n=1 Tax=Platanthera zijinensis TaxID=2320716 RepID=A0AAP0G7Z2_9ASPA
MEHLISGGTSQSRNSPHQESDYQYCTLESSAVAAVSHGFQQSANCFDLSYTTGSPVYSPACVSCVTEDSNDLIHKLRELETAILSPTMDNGNSFERAFERQLIEPEKRKLMGIVRADLKQGLLICARALADGDLMMTGLLISELRQMVSVSGEPIQRLGAYLLEGLIARLASTGSSIYKALKCKEPTSSELLSYMHILYEVCPYFKFGYFSANGAIAEAFKGEDVVHIIDFQIAQGSQWVSLIQALAGRPGGPPRVRITGIDDSISEYARGGGLHIVGQRLSRLAGSCNVPFEFHAVPLSGGDVRAEHLGVQPGEALAVNFPYQLHHMPDESVSTENHRDRILRMVKGLAPKVVTLVEQESNTNTAPFFQRFVETMDYYAAIFESIDAVLPRDHRERINVEQHCLARDIVNVIACEGAERVERHELLGKWKARFRMAGFTPYPLSPLVNATIKSLLGNYCEHYRLEERDGALLLGWKNRVLSVACAWL